MRKSLLGMGLGTVIFVACQTLPAFAPVFACLAGELSQGALEDPMLLIQGCAGATLAALIQAIQIELANPPATVDAGITVTVSGEGGTSTAAIVSTPTVTRVAYEAHLNRILTAAKALQATGAK